MNSFISDGIKFKIIDFTSSSLACQIDSKTNMTIPYGFKLRVGKVMA